MNTRHKEGEQLTFQAALGLLIIQYLETEKPETMVKIMEEGVALIKKHYGE